MKRAFVVLCALFMACGSEDRKGFDEKSSGGGGNPPAGGDNGLGENSGAEGTPLSCKGLTVGTKSIKRSPTQTT